MFPAKEMKYSYVTFEHGFTIYLQDPSLVYWQPSAALQTVSGSSSAAAMEMMRGASSCTQLLQGAT